MPAIKPPINATMQLTTYAATSSTTSRLPSLNALRAFTVAGRTLNLREASEILHVTASAMSHQIRGLEDKLGQPLFIRSKHGLQLTELGQAMLPILGNGFAQIDDAWRIASQLAAQLTASQTMQQRRQQSKLPPLTISTVSTFAAQWLIPRLEDFETTHPDITVHVTTSMKLADLQHDGVDCAIRWGKGKWSGVLAEPLYYERLTPIIAPELAQRFALQHPAQLLDLPLLMAQHNQHDLRDWCQSQQLKWRKPAEARIFDTRALMIQAVIARLGIAVVDTALIENEIRNGLLIAPFANSTPRANGYHLVRPAKLDNDPRFLAFREWVLRQTTIIL
ncbi:LysR substrate-binding domain-containing protein [Ampullimonas aquatilis]|uniref:LysR substrate-binding domain-containing protein n=1 Tax=Ampullimonas aquatilis TaxID=1341549 RepID=UPI003C750AAE